jgi:hypothetical protein
MAQDISTTVYDPPIPYEGVVDSWGTDYVVSNTEPLARPSGVYRTTNNTIYVAVPDTNIQAGRSMVVFSSTNNGANWSIAGTLSPGGVVLPQTKMVSRAGSDSVYCIFIFGSTVYSWNVITNNLNPFTTYTNVAYFDAALSSTNSLYLIVDLNVNNDVRFFGSVNGGVTWAGAIFLSSAATRPKIYMSGLGDTAVINYMGPILADTLTCAIRNVRYRESVPGSLVIVGTFTTPIAAGTPKDQFMGVRNGLNAWIFYTTGTTGSIDLNCITSVDGGTTYGAPVTIGSMPGRDEYWFDAKHYNGGVDLIYYSDSLQGGAPNNNSDKLYNSYAFNSTPGTFSTPAQISEHPPGWSANGYIPTLIEFYDVANDAGAIWVGQDGANKRLYFDRFGAVTGISSNGNEIPNAFSLSQNYPNPFNPSTKIDFAIPTSGLVQLKIYDMLGREVESIVNKDMTAGSYTVNFDASRLATGVYFYKLISGGFVDTKKMVLVK